MADANINNEAVSFIKPELLPFLALDQIVFVNRNDSFVHVRLATIDHSENCIVW